MALERHINSMAKKTGSTKEAVQKVIDDLEGQGMSTAEIHRMMTAGTGSNQHHTNPRAIREERSGNRKFFQKYDK